MRSHEPFNFNPAQRHEMGGVADLLPVVFVPLFPKQLPAELATLTDDARVVLRDEVAEFDAILAVSQIRKLVHARIARARLGRLSVREAAAVLAAATDDTKPRAYSRLIRAFEEGSLVFRETAGHYVSDADEQHAHFPPALRNAHYLLAEVHGDSGAYTTRDDLNRWLEKIGNPMRVDGEASASSIEASAPARRKPALREQEDAIIEELRSRGLNPQKLEKAPLGNKKWPLREEIRAKLGYSKEVMSKAWKRLRADGSIADAD
jgi:hypothetical protein